ncbi:MAG: GntR family transcriptional regulator [Gammaproteobacteria bacterium]
MADFWASRTGRWRIRLREESQGEIHERLFRVLSDEISDGRLPPGAIVPPTARVAEELRVDAAEVRKAFGKLLQEGLLEQRENGRICVADSGGSAIVGDNTQVLFENNLIQAARYATEMGMSTIDATGVFKARIAETKAQKDSDEDDQG